LTDALTHGVHHIGLAVRDLDEATSFFCGTLGFKEVGRNDAYPAVFVSDGGVTLTIWRVTIPATR
jgi:catechol 2,3-dioxygenase-like lactoylglutathione lyase family enzyme